MIKVNVCTGSSCRMKGAQFVMEDLQRCISRKGLENEIEICRTGCMGRCQMDVGVKVDGEYFSVAPSEAEDFFRTEILPRL